MPSAADRIAIDGDPNGLVWDAEANVLWIADGDHNRILRWTAAGGVEVHATLGGDPTRGRGLGQLVRLSDGSLAVTRFGDGTNGGVTVIAKDGTAKDLKGLDGARRRIGLAVAPDGSMFTAWFEKHGNTRAGAVARLDVATGKETTVIDGLQKPVGLVVVGDSLFVSDQRQGRVLKATLADLGTVAPFGAPLVDPDLLSPGPAGSLLCGGKNGEVRRIAPDGTIEVIARGFGAVRSVAYDAANNRIFIAEHDTNDADGLAHAVHIRQL